MAGPSEWQVCDQKFAVVLGNVIRQFRVGTSRSYEPATQACRRSCDFPVVRVHLLYLPEKLNFKAMASGVRPSAGVLINQRLLRQTQHGTDALAIELHEVAHGTGVAIRALVRHFLDAVVGNP